MQDPHSPGESQNFSRFEKLLVELARGGIDFAVVGGLAVILNGYDRLTMDVDILVADDAQNVERLLQVLRSWGEGWARELSLADFTPQEGSIRISEEFDLDVFTRMRGKSFQDFRHRFRSFESSGLRIAYLSPEDLIALKESSWREKDQLDVAAMREILKRSR